MPVKDKLFRAELLKNRGRNNLLLSQIVIAIMGLITGKIIAVYFSPEDFGLFNLQFATYTFFFSLFISPFLQYLKFCGKTFLPKIGYRFFLYLGVILMIICYLSLLIVSNIKFPNSYYLFLIFLFFIPANTLFNMITDYFNIQSLLHLFSTSNLIKSLGSLVFVGILFYINYKYSDGTTILWIIQIIGFLMGTLFFLSRYKLNFHSFYKISFFSFIKKYAIYAWPLTVLAFWAWVTNFFDRYVIEYYLDLDHVGIYNANYSIGSKFFQLLIPFFLTMLVPNVYKNVTEKEKKLTINRYVRFYIILSIPFLMIIWFLTEFIGDVLLSEFYKAGFYLIFWIAVAYFLLTLVFLYETIFYAQGKTKIILYSNVIAALINILLSITLIPIYGLSGACIATLSSFFTRFLVIQYYYRIL